MKIEERVRHGQKKRIVFRWFLLLFDIKFDREIRDRFDVFEANVKVLINFEFKINRAVELNHM